MPIGLTNAPTLFYEIVNDTLRLYLNKYTIVYLDDILIYLETLEEYKKHVEEVF